MRGLLSKGRARALGVLCAGSAVLALAGCGGAARDGFYYAHVGTESWVIDVYGLDVQVSELICVDGSPLPSDATAVHGTMNEEGTVLSMPDGDGPITFSEDGDTLSVADFTYTRMDEEDGLAGSRVCEAEPVDD